MKVTATIHNTENTHTATVCTNDHLSRVGISPKADGRGSGVNGGELLFLSLATCYCNDIFREAANMDINVQDLEVNVEGEFGGRGDPAKNVSFDVKISADASEERIKALAILTDQVAEIQNTLRIALPVKLKHIEIV